MAECESVESYLSISLYMFWVATELWELQYNPPWFHHEDITYLLRYYVAAILLVESIA